MGSKISGQIVIMINLTVSFNTLAIFNCKEFATNNCQRSGTIIRCWVCSLMMLCQASAFTVYLYIFSRLLTLTHIQYAYFLKAVLDPHKTLQGVLLHQGKISFVTLHTCSLNLLLFQSAPICFFQQRSQSPSVYPTELHFTC